VRSARRPLGLRAGVAGRHVLCAVPLGHPTPGLDAIMLAPTRELVAGLNRRAP
jgi:hypothetical protein